MRLPLCLRTTRAVSPKPAILGTFVLVLLGAMTTFAQAPTEPQPQPATVNAVDQNNQLMDQIAELRAQVAKLQEAVQQTGPGKKPAAKRGMKMGPGKGMKMAMEDDKSEMGGMASKAPLRAAAGAMKDDQGEMGSMSGGGPAGMGAGAVKPAGRTAGANATSSPIPGQRGASRLYHIGSTGFFLNHPQHITLTPDQKKTLSRLQEKAMIDRGSTQKFIDAAERDIYALTGAAQPDASKIRAKLGEIGMLRANQRMNFIRAVGEATNVLTYEQHLALMGAMASGKK